MVFLNKIKNHLKRQYGLLTDKRIKRILCIGMPIYIFLFILVFQPFIANLITNIPKRVLGAFLISMASSLIWTAHLYGIFYRRQKNSVGLTILIVVWVFVLIGFIGFFLRELLSNHVTFRWNDLSLRVYWSLVSGIIPMVIVIFIYEIYYIRSKVKTINQVNTTIIPQNAPEESQLITINSTIGKDSLSVPSNQILYIKAASNYIDVYYIDNDQNMKHALIRNTLTAIHQHLKTQSDTFFRCHNSYIINRKNIDRVIGNSAGYKAVLKYTNIEIPISKKYKEQIQFLTQ